MQSYSATTTIATFSTHRQRISASTDNRNRNHGLVPTRAGACPNVFQFLATPVQPASNRDFYLDTFFDPVWMSGPHVFSFSKDGTIVHPETYHPEPYPGYRASAASSSGRHVCGAILSSLSPPRSSSSVLSTPTSKASGRPNKDWKNIAISEQDDAEFAAREAEAEVRAQAEAKGTLMGLVHTWPPKPLPAPCTGCELLTVPRQGAGAGTWSRAGTGVRMGTQDSSAPALSYGSSRASEPESEVLLVVPGKRDVACRKEASLEKDAKPGRLQGKASGPLFGAPREIGQHNHDGFFIPLMAMPWAEDKLTISLKAILEMHEI